MQSISDIRILFEEVVNIVQNILISGLLLVFAGSYLEIPLLVAAVSHDGETCCSGGANCCCGSNASSKASGECSIACAGCCHHMSISFPQLAREFYPKAVIASMDDYSTGFYRPCSLSPYTFLITRDIFRPPSA